MESIADLLGKWQGARIEVSTNGGQLLSGLIEGAYQDYFILSSSTRLYFVPYTGVSSFYLLPEPDSQQATVLVAEPESFAGPTQRSLKERKPVKRGRS